MRGVPATRCDFPWHYTRLHIESRPAEGGALQTDVPIAARIQYRKDCPCKSIAGQGYCR